MSPFSSSSSTSFPSSSSSTTRQQGFLLLLTRRTSSLRVFPPQVFVFRDYLPHIVGDEAMSRQLGRYPGYNPKVDPTIANVFATAAYRFAHLAIQPVLSRLDDNYRENARNPSVPLFKAFFTPWRIVFEGEQRHRHKWSQET